jgi:uncharacterized DUF497 family protein
MHIIVRMNYEWDPKKSAANLRKHGIRFAEAVIVFQDESALTIEEQHSDEERFMRLGMDAKGRILVVVYTWREERVRIISARQATSREREKYER